MRILYVKQKRQQLFRSRVLDGAYFVKVEYLNVTDSNRTYEYVLDGCGSVECPFDVFTKIYQPRFPASPDVECGKATPMTTTMGPMRKMIDQRRIPR